MVKGVFTKDEAPFKAAFLRVKDTSLPTPTVTPEIIELMLKQPFEVAHGRSTHRRSLIVSLNDEAHVGHGEAPEIVYAGVVVEKMLAALDETRCSGELEAALAIESPVDRWPGLRAMFSSTMPLVAAIDAAGWDLYAKAGGQTVRAAMGVSTPSDPISCWTIGIDEPEVMMDALRAVPNWPAYKIKLGRGSIADDLAIVERLRALTPSPFRLDANTGWSPRDTIWIAERLVGLNVSFIEQPTPPDADDSLAEWVGDCALPVFADESCQVLDDVGRCAALGYAGVNVKPAKCGGLTPAKQMLESAKAMGMQTMLGCMIESSVGISAIAQLVGLADYADLDGAALIQPTGFDGVRLDEGRVCFPDRLGLGVVPKR